MIAAFSVISTMNSMEDSKNRNMSNWNSANNKETTIKKRIERKKIENEKRKIERKKRIKKVPEYNRIINCIREGKFTIDKTVDCIKIYPEEKLYIMDDTMRREIDMCKKENISCCVIS
jgi:hypothetical protein